jgi:hypothetical protein
MRIGMDTGKVDEILSEYENLYQYNGRPGKKITSWEYTKDGRPDGGRETLFTLEGERQLSRI